jgi:hypothetical protein
MLLSALLLWESTEAAVAVFLLELQIVVEWSVAEVLALACSCAGLELRKEVELQPLKRSAARPGRRKLSAFGRGCTSPNWGADSRLLWTDFELQTVKPPRAIPTGLYDRSATTDVPPPTRSPRPPIHDAPYSEPPWRRRRCPHRHAWQVSLPVTWLSSQCAFSRAPKGCPPGALGNQSLVEAAANIFAASSAAGVPLVSDIRSEICWRRVGLVSWSDSMWMGAARQ